MANQETKDTNTTKKGNSKEFQELQHAFNAVAKTTSGKKVLRYLMKECGFLKSGLVASCATGEINPLGSIYNEARKDVYYRIRQFLTKENIIAVEFKEDEDV